MANRRMDMLREMLEKDPTDPFLHYALALEYKANGDLQECNERLGQLALHYPNYLPTYYQLGQGLSEANELAAAVSIFKKGQALAREQGDAKTLGEIHEALLYLDADEE